VGPTAGPWSGRITRLRRVSRETELDVLDAIARGMGGLTDTPTPADIDAALASAADLPATVASQIPS